MTGEGALAVRINKINSKAFERVSSRGELEGVAADSSRLINEGAKSIAGIGVGANWKFEMGESCFLLFFFLRELDINLRLTR